MREPCSTQATLRSLLSSSSTLRGWGQLGLWKELQLWVSKLECTKRFDEPWIAWPLFMRSQGNPIGAYSSILHTLFLHYPGSTSPFLVGSSTVQLDTFFDYFQSTTSRFYHWVDFDSRIESCCELLLPSILLHPLWFYDFMTDLKPPFLFIFSLSQKSWGFVCPPAC